MLVRVANTAHLFDLVCRVCTPEQVAALRLGEHVELVLRWRDAQVVGVFVHDTPVLFTNSMAPVLWHARQLGQPLHVRSADAQDEKLVLGFYLRGEKAASVRTVVFHQTLVKGCQLLGWTVEAHETR